MSDPQNFERLPDQAALDELHRAFDEGVDDAAAVDGDPTGDGTPDWVDEDLTPPDAAGGDGDLDLVIVEQVPLDDAPDLDPEPARPTIVIGDDGGSEPIDPEQPTDAAPVVSIDTPPDDAADDPGAVDAVGSASTVGTDDGAATVGTAGPTIISIDDADLPDAVYIQGSLDADGKHSIVIIEDEEFDDAVDTEAGSDGRRGIEPRLRERRVAVKRAEGRRRLVWILAALGVVTAVVGTLAILGTVFTVQADQVTVTGNVYTDDEELDAVVEELVGTPTLRADTVALERRLERIPWVADARVRVQFPRAATIEIREREAWSTYQGVDRRFRVLDDQGRVLAVLDGEPVAYVLLGGPDPLDLQPGDFAPRGYAVASELAKNLTSSVRGRVSVIEVTADGSQLTLVLDDGDTRVRFGEARDLFAKLVRLETVLSSRDELPTGTIDVSTREVTLPDDAGGDAAGGGDG